MNKGANLLIFAVFAVILAGCAANSASVLMNSQTEIVKSRWSYFEPTEEFYNSIKPYETKMSGFGFSLKKEPNVTELGYLDVVNLFLSNPSIKKEELPSGIQDCLNSQDLCRGYRVGPQDARTKGRGDAVDFLLRWGRFKKMDRTTGWEAKFYLFTKGDIVVYKLWGGGTPNIDRDKIEKRPLGPLQELDLQKFIPGP